MKSKHELGLINDKEFEVYMQAVDMLEPLIPKPGLLVALVAENTDCLYQGLRDRIDANPEDRAMERNITPEDLEVANRKSHEAVGILRDKGISVVEMYVNPVEVYRRAELRYAAIYGARNKLGLLSELLRQDPRDVANEVVQTFSASTRSSVVVIIGDSMFTGKSVALTELVRKLGEENVFVFQPQRALRLGPEQRDYLVDRDKGMTSAITIDSNNLRDVERRMDDQQFSPRERPTVIIDSVMLFTESDAREAIDVISNLRLRFNVVVAGVSYTFRGEPFTFMKDLEEHVGDDPNWNIIKTVTRCTYCEKDAKGTRLVVEGRIADCGEDAFMADGDYEPVCVEEHPSCRSSSK
jgi:thymidine kinase